MADLILIDGVEFRQVPGWDDYAVSKCGMVASRRPRGRANTGWWRKIRTFKDWDGYPRWHGTRPGGRKKLLVHRCQLMAWVGPPPSPEHHACHNDGDRSHSTLENLRWGTAKENQQDMVRHGRSQQGEKHYSTRLTDDDVSGIREAISVGVSGKHLARFFGVSTSVVSRINRRKTWSHV